MSAEELHTEAELTKMDMVQSGPYKLILAKSEYLGQRRYSIHAKPSSTVEDTKEFKETDAFSVLGLGSYSDCPMTEGMCYSWVLLEFGVDPMTQEVYADRAIQKFKAVKEHFSEIIKSLREVARRASPCGLTFWKTEF